MTECLILSPYSEESTIQNVINLLALNGIESEFQEMQTGERTVKMLMIHFPENKRKVGRKKKHIGSIPLKEIEDKMRTQTVEEIAAEYNISRATLFRKLKEARENGSEQIYYL